MYVSPFIMGIILTIGVEVVILAAAVGYSIYKDNKKKNGGQ